MGTIGGYAINRASFVFFISREMEDLYLAPFTRGYEIYACCMILRLLE